ncbi:hypothetical protein GOODEAATRI_017774, partial [Goodea atripinnis]
YLGLMTAHKPSSPLQQAYRSLVKQNRASWHPAQANQLFLGIHLTLLKIRKTLEEVKVLSDLNHCNIVRYHSCWLEDTAYQWDTSTDSSSAS